MYCYKKLILSISILGFSNAPAYALVNDETSLKQKEKMPPAYKYNHINYEAGNQDIISIPANAMVERATSNKDISLNLPKSAPSPTEKNINLSPLYRARDILDVTQSPVRTYGKIFRLDENGRKTETTCTAQFVGSQYLLTAAHCLYDNRSKTYHKGISLSLGYDNGEAIEGLSNIEIVEAWVSDAAIDDIVSPLTEKCQDLAILKINKPYGEQMGWLGLRAVSNDWLSQNILYNFSYPHIGAAAPLKKLRQEYASKNVPEAQRIAVLEALDKRILLAEKNEPQFSQNDLYFQFGVPGKINDNYFGWEQSYSLGGRSGSAYIDSEGHIIGLVSRNNGKYSLNCRITPQFISELSFIIESGK